MPKTPAEMAAAIFANLPQKTGKSLAEWLQLIESQGPPTRKERQNWLKQEHQVGHVTASLLAAESCGEGLAQVYGDPDALVEAMYAGPKAGLRPLYDKLLKLARKLGKDVKVSPCKTYVPLARTHQFALIKPTTRTRVDLGLALPETKAVGRLEEARSLGNERMTHVVKLSQLAEIDGEVARWLKAAYELAE